MKKEYIVAIVLIVLIVSVVLFNQSSNNEDEEVVSIEDADVVTSAEVLESKTNDEGQVAVTVTPTNEKDWSFEVVLETHSVDLNTDLTQTSVLIDENGDEHTPIEWIGDPPGGHHREGILKFFEPVSSTRSVTLLIGGVGEVTERKFEWTTRP